MIWPTVWRGLSDEYGSWKTICISRRSGRICARAQTRDVAARRSGSCPAVGSSSLSISRAVVDLPQPDSPTMPSVSPRAHAERDVLDGVHLARVAGEHARGDREALGQALDLDQRRRRARAHAPIPRRAASRSAQSRRLRVGDRGGRRPSARPPWARAAGARSCSGSKRCGQRGWNAQPGGRWMTDGGEPSIARSCVDLGLDASASTAAGPRCTGAADCRRPRAPGRARPRGRRT